MNRNEFNEKLMNCKTTNDINNFFEQQNTQQFLNTIRSKLGTHIIKNSKTPTILTF